MDSEGSKQPNNPYTNNPRYPQDRYPGSYGGAGSFQNGLPYNYMVPSMPHVYYHGYPYMNPQYAGSGYHSGMPNNWRGLQYPKSGMHVTYDMPRNYYGQQNPRVAPRETKDKDDPKVINLDSEEQGFQGVIPTTRQQTLLVKDSQKIRFIEIDDDSIEKPINGAILLPSIKKSPQCIKNIKNTKANQKSLVQQEINKAQVDELRIKPIRKMKKNEKKGSQRIQKAHKQKRSAQLSSKQKKSEQLQKAKPQKVQKQSQQHIGSIAQTANKPKKPQVATKIEEPKKQIAKYLQSHGEIRHGKQFQCLVPEIIHPTSSRLCNYLQKKKLKLLARQIGAITFS